MLEKMAADHFRYTLLLLFVFALLFRRGRSGRGNAGGCEPSRGLLGQALTALTAVGWLLDQVLTALTAGGTLLGQAGPPLKRK